MTYRDEKLLNALMILCSAGPAGDTARGVLPLQRLLGKGGAAARPPHKRRAGGRDTPVIFLQEQWAGTLW